MKNPLKNATDYLHTIREIIEDVEVGMLTTISKEGLPSSRPMQVQKVDEQGRIWLFTTSSSLLANQIHLNPRVQITFSDSKKNKFLTASAIASTIADVSQMRELWHPSLKAWFPDGLETLGLILLKLNVQEAEYWNSPDSAAVRIAGFVKAGVTDQVPKSLQHEKVNLRH